MELAQKFLSPSTTQHRHYEALRAYFVEKLSASQVAARFGYSTGSIEQLVHKFRVNPDRPFFSDDDLLATPERPRELIRERVIELRKQNLSVYDISEALKKDGLPRTPAAVSNILREEGFAKLPRRMDDERPAGTRPTAADVANVNELSLTPRSFRTRYGGLFLFLPLLAQLKFDEVIHRCDLPGTKMIPAAHAMRSLLALKLYGNQRHSHVMSAVLDEGLALFAGLNVIPKRSYLTEYSCRIHPNSYPKLMSHWFDAVSKLGLAHGRSFDLDFHTIPFHGEDALIEKHYVSKRSRKQKGILAFLAQDGDRQFFCYANGDLRKSEQNDEIKVFAEFWKSRTGKYPEELIFDSKLTTYANLNWLNERGIEFITLRRRTPKLVHEIQSRPRSAWRKVELSGVSRIHKTPRILDDRVEIADYQGALRQISIADLGHEQPTLLLTNQLRRSAKGLVERYARRMLIENSIEDGINFFHIDALSSAVALKINCDLQLTLMASSLYRYLGQQIGNGYDHAKSRHIFRDLIDASASIQISERVIHVQFQKRAHNPYLMEAGFDKKPTYIPWLGRKLQLTFG
jgi:transposase